MLQPNCLALLWQQHWVAKAWKAAVQTQQAGSMKLTYRLAKQFRKLGSAEVQGRCQLLPLLVKLHLFEPRMPH